MNEKIDKPAEEQYEEAGSEDTREIGAKINGRLYSFAQRLVLEDRLSAFVPEDFTEMTEDFAKIK
jgi:hypothetical protein